MPPVAGEPRVIKRYSNRKLYDTRSSQYVTLEQIAQMIRIGEEVRVLDNSSKEDLTSVTLAQIIFEEEKRQKSFIPLGAMRHLIQSGGASLQELAQQAQARVLSVFRAPNRERGEGELDTFVDENGAVAGIPGFTAEDAQAAAAIPAVAPVMATSGDVPVDGKREESPRLVRELVDRSQHALEEWQRRADERIRHLVDSLSPFAALQKEVAQLSQRVAVLEAQLARSGAPTPVAPSTSDNPDDAPPSSDD